MIEELRPPLNEEYVDLDFDFDFNQEPRTGDYFFSRYQYSYCLSKPSDS